MRRNLLLSALLAITDVTAALRSGKHCFGGCDLTLNYIDFNDTGPSLSKKIRSCRSVLHAQSVYLCYAVYCGEEGRGEWLRGLNETCEATVGENIPPWSVVEDYAQDDIARVRRLHADEASWERKPPPFGEVVIPDGAFFERAFKTLDYAWFEVDTHWAYGMAMFWFWGIVVSFGICWRLTSSVQEARKRGWQAVPNSDSDIEGPNPKDHRTTGLLYAPLKRYIITPATFGYHCSQNIGWCTIPPRIQSLTIFAFVLLNIVLCCISYPVFSGNLYWDAVSTQLWRYISDRTGVLALANFPLIWLFGTRNNVLIWLTGWGFGTYNNFHRWVARVATVQAVVHSIGYTEMVFERGSWDLFGKYLSKFYFWNGEVATVLMVAISVCSVYALRRAHYEVFLVTHIVLSAIVLLTTFYHVEIFNGEWNIFIWPCLGIWILDRTLRAARVLAFDRRFWSTKATVTYDAVSNLVRLEVPCGKALLEPKPGSYYYVYILDELLFLHQNHPFTLAYVSTGQPTLSETKPLGSSLHQADSLPRQKYHTRGPRRAPSPESDPLLPPSHRTPSPAQYTDPGAITPTPSSSTPALTFLVRPYDGMTSRLRALALSPPYSSHSPPTSVPRTLRVLVEGPYGAPMSTSTLHTFSSILFIAGGTGIAVALSYLRAIYDSDAEAYARHQESIHIVWAVREQGMLSSVLGRDIPASVLSDGRVRITVHVTQDAELTDDIGPDGSAAPVLGSAAGGFPGVRLKAGRPDVGVAVEYAAAEAGTGSRLAVVACGPGAMADDARRACVGALGRGYRGVEYFEESFKW